MLEKDVERIPDLRFAAELLIVQPPTVAARLGFYCTPRNQFMGLDVDGRRVTFVEHVFYRFEPAKIVEMWSVIDSAAIQRQLQTSTQR